MRRDKSSSDAGKHPEDLTDGSRFEFEPSPQGRAIDKLHHDVEATFVQLGPIHMSDVRVGDAGHGPGLALEPTSGATRLRPGLVNPLECDPSVEAYIVGGMDYAHCSGSHCREYSVGTQDLAGNQRGCLGARLHFDVCIRP